MGDWTTHLLHSFADQAATWFVGVVLALLGIFSGRLTETVKFALNRADLRTKYYEQLAVDLSTFVFAVNRIVRVSFGSAGVTEEEHDMISEAYNESMNKLCSQEYVYLSWIQHYWNAGMVKAFTTTMEKVRAVDAVLIRMRGLTNPAEQLDALRAAFHELQASAHRLLVTATR